MWYYAPRSSHLQSPTLSGLRSAVAGTDGHARVPAQPCYQCAVRQWQQAREASVGHSAHCASRVAKSIGRSSDASTKAVGDCASPWSTAATFSPCPACSSRSYWHVPTSCAYCRSPSNCRLSIAGRLHHFGVLRQCWQECGGGRHYTIMDNNH